MGMTLLIGKHVERDWMLAACLAASFHTRISFYESALSGDSKQFV